MSGGGEVVFVGGAGPRIACEIVGAGEGAPTVFCAHGNSSHRGIFRPVMDRLLRDLHLRAVLVDMRGHGDSDHVHPPAYNPNDHAADLERVVRHVAPSRYAIVGHSAGALATAAFAARSGREGSSAPRAIGWIDIDPRVPDWQVQHFNARADAVARAYPDAHAATVALVRGIQKTNAGISEEALFSFVAEGLKETPAGHTVKLDPQTYATWAPGDLRPILPDIACPALIIRGTASIVSSASGFEELRAGLPRATAAEVEGGTHFVPLDHPSEVAALLAGFLRKELVGAP